MRPGHVCGRRIPLARDIAGRRGVGAFRTVDRACTHSRRRRVSAAGAALEPWVYETRPPRLAEPPAVV